jgi:hypothetical protein
MRGIYSVDNGGMRFLAAVLVVQLLMAAILILLVLTHNVPFVEGSIGRTPVHLVPTL